MNIPKFKIFAFSIAILLFFTKPAFAFDAHSCLQTHSPQRSQYMSYASNPEWQMQMTSSYNTHFWSLYCKIKSGEEGVNACNCAIAANPGNPINWNNLGQKLFRLGRYSQALNSYNHGLLLEADNSLILANRCGTLSMLEKYEQALASCDLAIAGNGSWGFAGEAVAWDNRGDALFNLGRYEESLASFERAIKLNPDYRNAEINRAIVLQKLGREIPPS